MNVLGISITRTHSPIPKAAPIVLMAASLAVAATGTAYAAWSTQATGTGTATARTMAVPTITAGAASTGTLLYPGLTADGSTAGGDLSLTIANSNPFPVTISAIAPGTGNVTSNKGANCVDGASNPTGVSVISKSANLTGTNLTIPANSSGTSVTINKVVSMSTASADGCQGAVFSFPATGVTLTFTS